MTTTTDIPASAGVMGCLTKVCRCCGECKPADAYYRTAVGNLPAYCKACHNIKVLAYQKLHPEKRKLARLNWSTKQLERLANATERTCSKCDQTKPAGEFHKLLASKVTLYCKGCHNSRLRAKRRSDPAYRAKCNAAKARDRAKQDKAAVAAYYKQWRIENSEHKRSYDKAYCKTHLEQNRRYKTNAARRARAKVSRSYVAHLLSRHVKLASANLPPEMVEAFRQYILIKRNIKTHNSNETN